jgi:hypothetical protein
LGRQTEQQGPGEEEEPQMPQDTVSPGETNIVAGVLPCLAGLPRMGRKPAQRIGKRERRMFGAGAPPRARKAEGSSWDGSGKTPAWTIASPGGNNMISANVIGNTEMAPTTFPVSDHRLSSSGVGALANRLQPARRNEETVAVLQREAKSSRLFPELISSMLMV